MLKRAAFVTSGVVATAVAASYAPSISLARTPKQEEQGWGFVGYDAGHDKAIVQFTGEANARLISIEEFEKMGGHPQLQSARATMGKV
mmetsp:Transcript_5466/g.8695  ORF Transcript_5466/g.8695 Transcript_5466/m.8695 type:complete len:88 (+) Transcript_5466:98-361(+)